MTCFCRFLARVFISAFLLGISFAASAQTLTITNGVQKYASLTSTTVNMSGRCELWVTNSATPLSGCTINLNSTDAWLFLPGVKPSVVVSTYLTQVKISGASAVADSNCRVVQYGQAGAVVIPHSSSFQPLTVFTGAEFTGTATSYSQWTYYTGAAYANVSSFKLKRGYQAVLAQSANGANWSKCYIAQDGDLEIGVLPPTLDKKVQFIYVTPWRWTTKKGIAGDPGISLLNVSWWYNWNISSSSSRDLEYVAIEQQPFWPGLGQNWKSLGINTLLGYNEPDNPTQDAYKNLTPQGSVSDAVARLPGLLATGLRIGSPATQDSGRSGWLYPFVNQADAAGYRVDFVAIHYYWCYDPSNPSGAANQMYNFLLDIWNNTHRPIWITEWNNGANWTGCADPTYAQQQACVSAMINMLESAPFVERYALYNWVEDVRSVTTNGVLTSAGVTYRDKVSSLSYSQVVPDNGTRGIAQYLFETNTWDTSGYYNNGLAVGAPNYTTGHTSQSQAIALDGANSYVQLPVNIAKGNAFTFAGWVNWSGGSNWQRIFDFGDDTSHYLFLTPSSGSTTLRFAINNGSGEQIVERAGALASGSWQHVAVTLNGTNAVLYVNGVQVASASVTLTPSAFTPIKNYLGKSQFPDPLFNGKLDDVEIADYAMTAAQIAVLFNGALYPTYTSGIWTNNASDDWSTSNNWNNGVIANGISRMTDFSTINITANQTVTLDSARTIGGLRFGDTTGVQNWFLSGTNTLTLNGGGANAPLIAVNQNTATISTPLLSNAGLIKSGNGTLALTDTNTLGGGLIVTAGSVNISGGATMFGSGTVGYLNGTGNLSVSGGNMAISGELRAGGSDQNGLSYIATGAVTVANATLSVGSLTVARGNYLDNAISGTVTLNSGGTLISTNDVVLQFAGTGRGKLALNGGNLVVGPNAGKWLMIGYWDSGSGELDITNGNVFLENNSSIKMCRSGNTGGNVVNQIGGNVTFYSDAGVTVGGGNLDLNYAGGSSCTNTYNLNGGTLTVPQIISSSSSAMRIFNFNGGTLKAATANSSFFASGVASSANVRNGGAKIDTAGYNVTVAQPLQHSAISGDSATDGGLTKNGAGTLTLSSTNTYTGATVVSSGTLALASTGSIANSRNLVVASGAVLDVSAVAGFTLGAVQTLAGNGSVNGAVVNNGTISPGGSGAIGTLTFSNSPTLNGVTWLDVDRNSGAPLSDQINVPAGGINYSGTLMVNNLGAPLTAGDSFQIFSAANYSGSFATLNLPTLGTGLAWNTDALTNGVLSVVATVAPQFNSIAQTSDGNFQFSGTGASFANYQLWATTNLVDWTLVTNTTADVNGIFNLDDPAATNFLQRFYRMVSP